MDIQNLNFTDIIKGVFIVGSAGAWSYLMAHEVCNWLNRSKLVGLVENMKLNGRVTRIYTKEEAHTYLESGIFL